MTARRGWADGGSRWWPGAALVAALSGWLVVVRSNPYTTVLGDGAVWPVFTMTAIVVSLAIVTVVGRRCSPGFAVVVVAWWLVVDVAGWTAAPVAVRVAATAAAVLVAPLTAAVALLGTVGTSPWVIARVVLAVAGVTAALGQLVLVDPFSDPDCWRLCERNPFLVADRSDLARPAVAGVVTTAAAVAVVAAVRRAAAARSGARTGAGGVASAELVSTIATAVLVVAAALLTVRPGPTALVVAGCAATAAAMFVGVERWRLLRLRHELCGLAADLERTREPAALAEVLADGLADPALTVAYWSPVRGAYLDLRGRPVDLAAIGDRTVTTVARAGAVVAAIVHRRDVDPAAVDTALTPAVRLWLANQQLGIAARAELADLRASEARLAEQAQTTRRALERNLHDGAQQRVVGVALLLRMLRTRDHDPSTAADLERAAAALDALLNDLRSIGSDVASPRNRAST